MHLIDGLGDLLYDRLGVIAKDQEVDKVDNKLTKNDSKLVP